MAAYDQFPSEAFWLTGVLVFVYFIVFKDLCYLWGHIIIF